jgi:hypothetical protein
MRRSVGLSVVVSLALGMSACGSGGPGSVTGDPAYAFEVKSAFRLPTASDEGQTVAEVLLLDQTWTCEDLKAADGIDTFALIAFHAPSAEALTPGDFTVVGLADQPTGSFANVLLSFGNNDLNVTSGLAKLDDLSSDSAEGTFEVTDGTAHLSGTFDATACDYLAGYRH